MENHPEEWLSAYLDNELDADEFQRIEAHLETCQQCRLILGDLAQIKLQVSNAYRSTEAPRHMEQRIMQAIENKAATRSIAKIWVVVPLAGLLCLTAVWLLLGTVLFKLLSVLFKFTVAAAYLFSHAVSAIPSLWGATVVCAILIALISSFSLRRLLRSTTS